MASPERKIRTIKEMVLAAQAGDDNIQYMLPVACEKISKGKFTTATTKSGSFDEKKKFISTESGKWCK